MTIKIPYFSANLNAIPGNINAAIPAPILAPQTGAPIVQTCSAPIPKMIPRIPINEDPLALADITLSLTFLMKQVAVKLVIKINVIPRMV